MTVRNIISIIMISILASVTLITGCRNTTVTNTQNSPNWVEQTTTTDEIPSSHQISIPSENAPPEIIDNTEHLKEELIDTNCTNIIIDHTNWDWYNSQPQHVIENVAKLRVFFTHASIGNNIIDGMKALHTSDATKYALIVVQEDGTPPDVTIDGSLYEYHRGNPDWTEKLNIYINYTINGWRYPTINISMNKLCAIDEETVWEIYRDSMLALEAAYPETVFIYFTIPYFTTAQDSYSNTISNDFNDKLRSWLAIQNHKVLFDIADIEAWSLDRVHQTFVVNDVSYETLYTGFTDDGVHLNEIASQRIATGLYSLFGKIILK